MNTHQQKGKELYQQYNCQSCHQIFGLGGYLGPELTTIISDKTKGPAFAKIILQNGAVRMPNFHLKENEIDEIIDYLKYVDSNAFTYKVNQSK
mgnify:CR=1 FL=1